MDLDEAGRIHARIDKLSEKMQDNHNKIQESIMGISVNIAKLQTEKPERPCDLAKESGRLITEHLREHDINKKTMWDIALKFLNPAALLAALAALWKANQ